MPDAQGSSPDTGGETDEPTDTATSTPEATTTATPTDGPSDASPPGADVLGGPDDLQSDTMLRAATLDSDQGAGQFVFTPAIVWVEAGTTLTWNIERGSHSVTAYHRDNDKPHRIPEDVPAFDSREHETPGPPPMGVRLGDPLLPQQT